MCKKIGRAGHPGVFSLFEFLWRGEANFEWRWCSICSICWCGCAGYSFANSWGQKTRGQETLACWKMFAISARNFTGDCHCVAHGDVANSYMCIPVKLCCYFHGKFCQWFLLLHHHDNQHDHTSCLCRRPLPLLYVRVCALFLGRRKRTRWSGECSSFVVAISAFFIVAISAFF